MSADRIVEVYSGSNVLEAHSLRAILEEEGIPSHVVGEALGNAAGWLPLGETTSPRIWVCKDDESRAVEIIGAWLNEHRSNMPLAEDGDDGESDEPIVEVTEQASTGNEPVTLVGKLMATVGVGCILASIPYAMQCRTALQEYEGTAKAILVESKPRLSFQLHVDSRDTRPRRDLPFLNWSKLVVTSIAVHDCRYRYDVGGKAHYAKITRPFDAPPSVTVCYNPRDPADHVIGTLTPPWLPLVVGGVSGLFLVFVAFQFR
jgi:hypothetical protein